MQRPADPAQGVSAPVLPRHRPPHLAVLALLWLTLAVGECVNGRYGPAAAHTVLAVISAAAYVAAPGTWVRHTGSDGLTVQHGRRRRIVARSEVVGVDARHTRGGYGVELRLLDGDAVLVPGTALRFSVAAAQAAELRRWAGLAGPVS